MLSSGSSFLLLYELLLLKTEMLGSPCKGTQRSACTRDAIKFELKFVLAKAHCHMNLRGYSPFFLPTGRALYLHQGWTESLVILYNWSTHTLTPTMEPHTQSAVGHEQKSLGVSLVFINQNKLIKKKKGTKLYFFMLMWWCHQT